MKNQLRFYILYFILFLFASKTFAQNDWQLNVLGGQEYTYYVPNSTCAGWNWYVTNGTKIEESGAALKVVWYSTATSGKIRFVRSGNVANQTANCDNLDTGDKTVTISQTQITGNEICCNQTLAAAGTPSEIKQKTGVTVGSPLGGTFSYQWTKSTDGTNFTNISGATILNYSPSSISSTTYYQRLVKSSNGTVWEKSNIVKITVTSGGTGGTCLDHIGVSARVVTVEEKNAVNTVNKTITIDGAHTNQPGGNFKYIAGELILLKPGAQFGPGFTLRIAPCGVTSPQFRKMEDEPIAISVDTLVDSSDLTAIPNPSNELTLIKYKVGQKGKVKLLLTNENGQVLITLLNKVQEKGDYQTFLDSSKLRPGVYLYSLETNTTKEVKRLIIQH